MSTLHTPQSWLHQPPDWWNENGFRMRIHTWSPGKRELYLATPFTEFAKLRITSLRDAGSYFRLTWSINQVVGENTSGEFDLSRDDLEEMFALGECEDRDDPVHEHYEREYGYLNIPKRGTGKDGDPNLSVFVSNEIRQAVSDLLELEE